MTDIRSIARRLLAACPLRVTRAWRIAFACLLLFVLSGILFWKGFNRWAAAAPATAALLYLIALLRHLCGPHLFYDPIRLARRGRVTALRVLFLGVLFVALAWSYHDHAVVLQATTMSRITQEYTYGFFVLQNLTILLLTPVYVGSAIAEERERRSFEVLFTTPLRAWEIVLGIFGGRLVLVSSFVLAAVPILALLQLWGGVDMPLLLGNEINSVMLLVTVGAVCILASALAPTIAWGLAGSYGLQLAWLVPCGVLAALEIGTPFLLYDARIGGTVRLTVQQSLVPLAFFYFLVTAACLCLAIAVLRNENAPVVDPALMPRQPEPLLELAPAAAPEPGVPARPSAEEEELAARRALPPVADDALWWKECCTGGRALVFTPFGASFLLLFVVYSVPSYIGQHDALGRFAVLQIYYAAFLLFYGAGAAFRATAAIARERQERTLDMLLQIPDDRSVILRAKWYGALRKGWIWLLLAVVDIGIGLVLGDYTPLLALWMLVAPIPLLLFVVNVGLLLSLVLGTVLRARLVLGVLLLGLFFGIRPGPAHPIPGLPGALGYDDVTHIGTVHEARSVRTARTAVAVTFGLQAVYAALAALSASVAWRRFAARPRRLESPVETPAAAPCGEPA